MRLLALVGALLCMFRQGKVECTGQHCFVVMIEVFTILNREGPTDNALAMKAWSVHTSTHMNRLKLVRMLVKHQSFIYQLNIS